MFPRASVVSQSQCFPFNADKWNKEEVVQQCGAAVTLGRSCHDLLVCSSFLAQLLLCLQDRVLKLGFLVDVAEEKTNSRRLKAPHEY